MNKKELPMNLRNALAKNEDAMKQFDTLSDSQKQAVINKTRKINSNYEMDCFLDYFSNGSLGI
ncbi:MAG: YdeI/OmpD-associated family protein [Eubacterium sp.]|nr:YdeI/OmpD-associated family protein [Eubacterium sp.]